MMRWSRKYMFKDRRRCPRFGEERRKSENIFCVRIEEGLEDDSPEGEGGCSVGLQTDE